VSFKGRPDPTYADMGWEKPTVIPRNKNFHTSEPIRTRICVCAKCKRPGGTLVNKGDKLKQGAARQGMDFLSTRKGRSTYEP
jgi:hypothetical protein